MANSNFVVHNGLTVGPLTIDATTGNITTTSSSPVAFANLAVTATTASTTYTDGALVVAGGVGIGGNVHIQSGKQLHVGPDLVGSYSNVLAQFSANVNSYSQILLQNISNGLSASSDYICVADTGTDSINYIDHGINSSNYSDVAYTIGTGLDGYSYTNGGNYAIGTQTTGKNIIFHTGGTLSANLRAKITDVGLTVNTTTATSSITTGALVINGGCGIAGDLRLGGNLYVTNVISSSTNTITVNDPMLYLTADTPYPYNYDIGFYSAFTGGPANVYAHTGLVRNDADGAWNLFSNIAEPGAGQISLTNAIYDAINTGALTIKGDPVTSIINGGTSGVGNIGAAAGLFNTVYASKLQGVMQTASHPLITTLGGLTSVGTLTSLGVSGAITVNSGNGVTALINGGTTGVGNIGATGAIFNTVFATSLSGTLTTASQPSITTLGGVTSIGASGTTTITGILQTAAQTNITSLSTLTSLAVSGAITVNSGNGVTALINGGTTGVGNIGSSTVTFNTVFAKATTAQYADVAERYTADAHYVSGTVISFGGDAEVTISNIDTDSKIAGIITTNPAYLMNNTLTSEFIAEVALLGRVPCLVQGTVRKGDLMVSAGNGRARAEANPKVGSVIGKALANSEGDATIEVVVGRV